MPTNLSVSLSLSLLTLLYFAIDTVSPILVASAQPVDAKQRSVEGDAIDGQSSTPSENGESSKAPAAKNSKKLQRVPNKLSTNDPDRADQEPQAVDGTPIDRDSVAVEKMAGKPREPAHGKAAPAANAGHPDNAKATNQQNTVATPTIDINTATVVQLETLPGIGPVKAQAILDLRQRLKGFHQLRDLLRVRGIGRATLQRLQPHLTLGSPTS